MLDSDGSDGGMVTLGGKQTTSLAYLEGVFHSSWLRPNGSLIDDCQHLQNFCDAAAKAVMNWAKCSTDDANEIQQNKPDAQTLAIADLEKVLKILPSIVQKTTQQTQRLRAASAGSEAKQVHSLFLTFATKLPTLDAIVIHTPGVENFKLMAVVWKAVVRLVEISNECISVQVVDFGVALRGSLLRVTHGCEHLAICQRGEGGGVDVAKLKAANKIIAFSLAQFSSLVRLHGVGSARDNGATVMEALATCFRLSLAPSADATTLGKSAKRTLDQVCASLNSSDSNTSGGAGVARDGRGGVSLENASEWADVFMSRAHSNATVNATRALDALVFVTNCVCNISNLKSAIETWAIDKRIQMSTHILDVFCSAYPSLLALDNLSMSKTTELMNSGVPRAIATLLGQHKKPDQRTNDRSNLLPSPPHEIVLFLLSALQGPNAIRSWITEATFQILVHDSLDRPADILSICPPWRTDTLHKQVVHHLTRSVLDLAQGSAFGVLLERTTSVESARPTPTPLFADKSKRSNLEDSESRLDSLVRLLARLTSTHNSSSNTNPTNERDVFRNLMRAFPCADDNGASTRRTCLLRVILESCLANDGISTDILQSAAHPYIWSRQAIALTSVLVRLPRTWLTRAFKPTDISEFLGALNDTGHSLWDVFKLTGDQPTEQQQYQRLVILISFRSVVQAMCVMSSLNAVTKVQVAVAFHSTNSLLWINEALDTLVSLTSATPSLTSKVHAFSNISKPTINASMKDNINTVSLATTADLVALTADIAKCGVVQPLLHGFKTLSSLLGNYRVGTQTWAVVHTCHLVQEAGNMEAKYVTPEVRDSLSRTLASALAVASCRNTVSPLLQFVLLNVERFARHSKLDDEQLVSVVPSSYTKSLLSFLRRQPSTEGRAKGPSIQSAIALNVSSEIPERLSEGPRGTRSRLSQAYSADTFGDLKLPEPTRVVSDTHDRRAVSPQAQHDDVLMAGEIGTVQSVLRELFARVPLTDVKSLSPKRFRTQYFGDIRILSEKLVKAIQDGI